MRAWFSFVFIWSLILPVDILFFNNSLIQRDMPPLFTVRDGLQVTNTFNNGGFENGTGNLPSDWGTSAWRSPGAAFLWNKTEHVTGSRSVEITLSSPNDARWTQRVNVNPCMDYRLSGWIKSDKVIQTLEANNIGANLSILEDSSIHTDGLLGTNDWTYQETIFSVGNKQQVSVSARLGYYSGTTTGTAWFDDIKFEELQATAITLNNPGFEVTSSAQSVGWQSEVVTGTGVILTAEDEAHSGNKSGFITLTRPGVARLMQQIEVEADTEYVLSGWVRSSNITAADSSDNGAKLAVYGIPKGILEESTFRIQGTNEWEFICQTFVTGSVTKATIACTLGEQAPGRGAEIATGTMWCDDIRVVKKRTFPRTQIQKGHIALDYYTHIYEHIEDPDKYLDILNIAYDALVDLTGSQPFNGTVITIRTEASMYAGGRSGNPIKLPPTPRSDSINSLKTVDAVAIHELGHTFDLVPYSNLYRCWSCNYGFINGEVWTFFYSIYAYEQISLKYPELKVDISWPGIRQRVPLMEAGKRMVAAYAIPWQCQNQRDYKQIGQLIYPSLLYTIQQKVGWEPFEKVFREYRDNIIPIPPTEEEKVKLWAITLSRMSGRDLLPYFQGWGFPVEATRTVSYTCVYTPIIMQ